MDARTFRTLTPVTLSGVLTTLLAGCIYQPPRALVALPAERGDLTVSLGPESFDGAGAGASYAITDQFVLRGQFAGDRDDVEGSRNAQYRAGAGFGWYWSRPDARTHWLRVLRFGFNADLAGGRVWESYYGTRATSYFGVVSTQVGFSTRFAQGAFQFRLSNNVYDHDELDLVNYALTLESVAVFRAGYAPVYFETQAGFGQTLYEFDPDGRISTWPLLLTVGLAIEFNVPKAVGFVRRPGATPSP